MKIFIDFDDVLFNSKKFYADLTRVFVGGGISKRVFQQDYFDYPIKGKSGLRKYNAWTHLEILQQKGFKMAGVKAKLDQLIKNSNCYIFKDAKNFLQLFKDQEIYLVSYGDTDFQEAKIKHSQLRRFFGKIIVSDLSKEKVVNKILKNNKKENAENLYFLDDRIENILKVKSRFPCVTVMLVKRKEGRYNDRRVKQCDFVVETLWKAGKIIKNLEKKR